jgi:hypothetical protein
MTEIELTPEQFEAIITDPELHSMNRDTSAILARHGIKLPALAIGIKLKVKLDGLSRTVVLSECGVKNVATESRDPVTNREA